ncbi:ferritin-like domain-containing protein [Tengunoibacter tsumagoiensis]|uniref:Ferritin-like domain-containing protein n=1 Tax=Tengunoibacter tsumagoiensis TaxID=2014871 RepID=A0A401ZZT2_9CHLR|nr:ferritin-like domain-containing protein [Tengunoibacter tsumagoiensis]GCE12354.1 hypothetical protein KTT_22130 [Tengunoibacter tsumagoiensis]
MRKVLLPASCMKLASTGRRQVVSAAIFTSLGFLASCNRSTDNSVEKKELSSDQHELQQFPIHDKSDLQLLFTEIMNDENLHITFLRSLIQSTGNSPLERPAFQHLKQPTINDLISIALKLKEINVGAYLLCLSRAHSSDIGNKVATILGLEARHASFLNLLSTTALSTQGAFEHPLTASDIFKGVTPFLSTLTRRSRIPVLTVAPDNDKDLLQFLLLLEYLSSELYNLNVPDLFSPN